MNFIWKYLKDVFGLTASVVSGVINTVVNGTFIVRKTGGVAGTDEIQFTHDGNTATISNMDGATYGVALADVSVRILNTTRAGISTAQNYQFLWSDADNEAASAANTGLERLASGVVGATNGSTGTGWFQNQAGESALESDFTRADDTMTATTLSLTLISGRSYRITGCLKIANSTATDGCKIDFNGGAATITTFFAGVTFIGSVTAGVVVSEALDTDLTATVVTGTDMVIINGYVECDAGGTFILRAAEVTDAGGTLTIGAGSWLALYDTVDK